MCWSDTHLFFSWLCNWPCCGCWCNRPLWSVNYREQCCTSSPRRCVMQCFAAVLRFCFYLRRLRLSRTECPWKTFVLSFWELSWLTHSPAPNLDLDLDLPSLKCQTTLGGWEEQPKCPHFSSEMHTSPHLVYKNTHTHTYRFMQQYFQGLLCYTDFKTLTLPLT